jgi:cytochrome b involved in lipid metabolism
MKNHLTRPLRSSLAFLLIIPILAAGCTSSSTSTSGQTTPSAASGNPASAAASASASYTASDVSKHATPDDCWLIVDGGVYDVTSFVSKHPGGSDKIAAFCGKDASAPFHQKPNGQPHSQRASDMLKTLQIGALTP